MNNSKSKLFYSMGLLLVFFNYIYAESGIIEDQIPQEINAYIKEGVQKNTIVLIDQMIKKKQAALLEITKIDLVKHTPYEISELVHKTPKTDLLKYTSLYDDIAELIYQKNQLLSYLNIKGITDDYNTDQTCDFIYDYEMIEIVKREFFKTKFHDDIAKTVHNIASLFKRCNPPLAKRYLLAVLDIKENLYSKVSPEAAKAYDALGNYSQFYMANFGEAIKYYDEAIRVRKKLYGATDLNLRSTENKERKRIRKILYGTTTDPRISENYDSLARSIYYYNRAEKILQHSINIRKKIPSHKDFSLYTAYMDKGMYHIMTEEYSKSIYDLKEALASFEGKINDDYIMILSKLSDAYLNTDDLKNSLIYAKKAYTKAKEFYKDSQHLEVVMYLNYLTQITEIIGEKEREKACNTGDIAECLTLGNIHIEEHKYYKAKKLFSMACDNGNPVGCANLGAMYAKGTGVNQDNAMAVKLYEKACRGGNATGCSHLGTKYARGEGVAQDIVMAVKLYTKACDKGSAIGCSNLGFNYIKGIGVEQNTKKAISLFSKSCDAGDSQGCYNLGYMHNVGQGVIRDYHKAKSFYTKACDTGYTDACFNLGFLYSNGQGVKHNYCKAKELYKKACEGQNLKGCYNLADIYENGYGTGEDYLKAKYFYRKACDGGISLGCDHYYILNKKSTGDEKNPIQKQKEDSQNHLLLYTKSCEANDGPSCTAVGMRYGMGLEVVQSDSLALKYFTKACELNDANGCHYLADMYAQGKGIQVDGVKATEFYKKACELGSTKACSYIVK